MAKTNPEQIRKVAEFLKSLPDTGMGLNFYSFTADGKEIIASNMYPPLNHPQTLNFFFFTCIHQYGFWTGDENGYVKPLFGTFRNKLVKGSDLLWKTCKNALDHNPEQFEPRILATIEPEELTGKIFIDDNGPIPFPDIEERFKLTRMYGQWFVNNKLTPADIVYETSKQESPLKYFLKSIRHIPGFDQDPLQKKNILLAMALANRPEHFLKVGNESWPPIVDYHLMRVALRLGLVDLDRFERKINRARRWVGPGTEHHIRSKVYSAIRRLIRQSGKPMAFVDEMMWNARKYCPEMTAPDCGKCIFKDVCKKRTNLFQPVIRTTAY